MIQLMKILCFSVISLSFLLCVCCQICTRRERVSKWSTVTYFRTYQESYKGNCFFRCIKTRMKSYIDRRMAPIDYTETKSECCPGYIRDESSYSLKCDPICLPSCKNGYCESPGKCVCNNGYEVQMNHCEPVCENGCPHGTCVRPNVCECAFGYMVVNDTCQAICTEPCVNGYCVGPDTCECSVGYRKNEYNVCWPYCPSGCLHGTCMYPEVCVCDDGWHNDETGGQVCIPRCDVDCGEGKCISPNVCECNTGNEKAENGACLPHYYIPTTIDIIATTAACDCTDPLSYKNCGIICTTLTTDVSTETTITNDASDETTLADYFDESNRTSDAVYRNNHDWISYAPYIGAGIGGLLFLILMSILVIKRKTIARTFHGGSYSVEST